MGANEVLHNFYKFINWIVNGFFAILRVIQRFCAHKHLTMMLHFSDQRSYNLDHYIYIYIYIYIYLFIYLNELAYEVICTFYYLFIYLFTFLVLTYVYISSLILSSENMYVWHKALLMGYSMRLELTHVCCLNGFQLVMTFYEGHSSLFLRVSLP